MSKKKKKQATAQVDVPAIDDILNDPMDDLIEGTSAETKKGDEAPDLVSSGGVPADEIAAVISTPSLEPDSVETPEGAAVAVAKPEKKPKVEKKPEIYEHGIAGTSKAFGGDVAALSIPESIDLFLESPEVFTKTGTKSFLSSLGIPYGFYNKQNEEIQKDVMLAQKGVSHLKFDDMLIVMDETSHAIRFAGGCKQNSLLDPYKDPAELLGLDPTKDGIRRAMLDYYTGMVRYRYFPQGLEKGDYTVALYMDIPIFYGKQMKYEVGFEKVLCTNGMVDTIFSQATKIKSADFGRAFLMAFMQSSVNTIGKMQDGVKNFCGALRELESDTDKARNWIAETLIDTEYSLPKSVAKKALEHMDMIEQSKNLPVNSPKTVRSMYDVMDTLTFYGSRMATVGSQSKAQAVIFQAFNDELGEDPFTTVGGSNLQAIAVEEYNQSLND